jgi:hypothetical protein
VPAIVNGPAERRLQVRPCIVQVKMAAERAQCTSVSTSLTALSLTFGQSCRLQCSRPTVSPLASELPTFRHVPISRLRPASTY